MECYSIHADMPGIATPDKMVLTSQLWCLNHEMPVHSVSYQQHWWLVAVVFGTAIEPSAAGSLAGEHSHQPPTPKTLWQGGGNHGTN